MSRLAALVRPTLDVPISAAIRGTAIGRAAVEELRDLLHEYDAAAAAYVQHGRPCIFEVHSPTGWSIYVDLAMPASEVGAAEVAILEANLLIVVGSTARDTAARVSTERMAMGQPAAAVLFRPLPPPRPPRAPEFDVEIATRAGAPEQTPLAERLRHWKRFGDDIRALGISLIALPRAVRHVALARHSNRGPPWRAHFRHADGHMVTLTHAEF